MLTSEQILRCEIRAVRPLNRIIRDVEVLKERHIVQGFKGGAFQLVTEIDHPVHVVVEPQMNLVVANVLCFCNLQKFHNRIILKVQYVLPSHRSEHDPSSPTVRHGANPAIQVPCAKHVLAFRLSPHHLLC